MTCNDTHESRKFDRSSYLAGITDQDISKVLMDSQIRRNSVTKNILSHESRIDKMKNQNISNNQTTERNYLSDPVFHETLLNERPHNKVDMNLHLHSTLRDMYRTKHTYSDSTSVSETVDPVTELLLSTHKPHNCSRHDYVDFNNSTPRSTKSPNDFLPPLKQWPDLKPSHDDHMQGLFESEDDHHIDIDSFKTFDDDISIPNSEPISSIGSYIRLSERVSRKSNNIYKNMFEKHDSRVRFREMDEEKPPIERVDKEKPPIERMNKEKPPIERMNKEKPPIERVDKENLLIERGKGVDDGYCETHCYDNIVLNSTVKDGKSVSELF